MKKKVRNKPDFENTFQFQKHVFGMSVSTHLGVFEMTPISELPHNYMMSRTSLALIEVAVIIVFLASMVGFTFLTYFEGHSHNLEGL